MPDETTTPETPPQDPPRSTRSSYRPPPPAGDKPAEKTDEELAEEGHPNDLAQIKLVNVAGPTSLLSAINGLPPIGALQGIKANFEHYSKDELIDALKTLPLPEDNAGAIEQRDEIVRKLEAGDFKR